MRDDRQRFESLFEEAINLPVEQRESHIRQACGKDTALADELVDLVQRHELANTSGLFEPPMFSGSSSFGDNPTVTFRRGGTPMGGSSGSGGLHVRCPHCHNPIELVPDAPLEDIECPSCGSHFSLVDESQETRESPAVTKIGQFDLVDRIGMGAFGTVWKARDTVLDRTVAVKIPRKGQLSPEESEKFIREARSAAQLRHPNIVSVHEVGKERDSLYIVSDFVHGVPLSDRLDEGPLSHRESVELATKIALALSHAHEAGVIHRDLKPHNIMIDDAGEPHLTDFGLAKREAGEITMTLDGVILGTPAYMSPEQAKGEGHAADRRSDIYALGVVLYQMLTGELPFRGSKQMLIHKVINEEPTSLRRLDPTIPRDLETICLKCMEKDPGKRFANAQEIVDELNRWRRGEPIHTRPISAIARAWRWCKRNRGIAFLSAAILLISTSAAVVTSVYAYRANQARNQEAFSRIQAENSRAEAIGALKKAEQNEKEAAWNLYVARMYPIRDAWKNQDYGHLSPMLNELIPQAEGHDFRGWEWCYYRDLCDPQYFTIHARFPAWHPHESQLAVVVGRGKERRIELWSPTERRRTNEISVPATDDASEWSMCDSLRWIAGGSQLAIGDSEGVVVVDSETGRFLFTHRHDAGGYGNRDTTRQESIPRLHRQMVGFDVSLDGTMLATSNWFGWIETWDLETGRRRRLLLDPDRRNNLYHIAFNNTASHLAAALRSGRRATWELETDTLSEYTRQSNKNGYVAWNPHGLHFAATEGDFVAVYPVGTKKPIAKLKHLRASSVCWIDGDRMATSGQDHEVRIWDANSFHLLKKLHLHDSPVGLVKASADGRFLASTSYDKVKVSEVDTVAQDVLLLAPKSEGKGDSHLIAWDRSGRFIASGHLETVGSNTFRAPLRIWDVASHKVVHQALIGSIRSLDWSQDGSAVWATTMSGKFYRFERDSGELSIIKDFNRNGGLSANSFSPNGQWLALGYDNPREMILADTRTASTVRALEVPGSLPSRIRWNEQSSRLAVGSWGLLSTWEPFQNKMFDKRQFSIEIGAIAWDPSSHGLAVGMSSGLIRILDAETLKEIAQLEGHTGMVKSIDWADNGRRIASASIDGSVKVWDAATGSLLLTLSHPDGHSFSQVSWSDDGRRLAAGAYNGDVLVWGSDAIMPVPKTAAGLDTGIIKQHILQSD